VRHIALTLNALALFLFNSFALSRVLFILEEFQKFIKVIIIIIIKKKYGIDLTVHITVNQLNILFYALC
jgi:hypothetical protein